MKLDFNIQINQRQGLALTAQVQQAIKLLHMTNQEILEFVEGNFQENPFIETNEYSDSEQQSNSSENNTKELDEAFTKNPYTKNEYETKTSLENQFETGETFIPNPLLGSADTDFDKISTLKSTSKSLYHHCAEFIESVDFSIKEKIIALRFLEELEPTGWLCVDLSKIAEELKCEAEILSRVLNKLQTIEPAGLFAQNLRECLILQAKELNTYEGNLAKVLDNLHLIANGKFELLKRRCNCSDEEISQIFKAIKSFDPKPGLKFDWDQTSIREPDLLVYETDEDWVVELNNSTLPNVKVGKNYAIDARRQVHDKKEKEFIKNKVSEAKWLVKAIEKRNDTMIRVGSEIVKRQRLFLEKGLQFIKPMVLKDIAEAVGMHESTISRVTTGSLIQTPQGTIELKSFFSIGLQQDDDHIGTSATSIRFKIKKLIETEDPIYPISDDAIVDILAKQGINLARRTVAKYRKIENIPSSFGRKRRNVISGLV